MSYEVLITTPGLSVWDHDAAEGVTLGLVWKGTWDWIAKVVSE